LDKLSKRWQSTGLWSKLLDRKVLVSEPRSGDKLGLQGLVSFSFSEKKKKKDKKSDILFVGFECS